MLEQLSLPRIERVAHSETHGRYEIEPLEEGYGVTLGNSLRRILLSSLPGAAITAVRIDGIRHEFSDIPNVREDVTEFMLNLKKVRLKYTGNEPIQIELDIARPGEVYASDLIVPSQVEIVNPEQYLLTVDGPEDQIELHAEITVERGKGYAPIDQRENLDIGTIPIDAIFAPIRRVNYMIERTRVGPMTTYERLILEIWTDGTMTPDEALNLSAQILTRHFQQIAEFSGHVEMSEIGPSSAPSRALPPQIYDTPIEALDLSPRAYNSLKRAGVGKVGEVLEMSEDDLLNVRNFGRKSLDELRDRLILKGYIPESRAYEQFGGAFQDHDDFIDDDEE
ncbi:MAG TPA: DNA-directed RNA polymerase subunit alpha [Chloroflexota bacterium]|nr:DNA-directed RNA polymerase subunit alpha [Chloroflexota bacterium]